MKSEYIDKLMHKYGISEEDAEIISELKRRIRKISPLTKEQKGGCEVCGKSFKEETIYNHHIMKVEYLAVLTYYYDLYKKEKNPCYVENRGNSKEEINTQSEKEYIYILKKNFDLYIPRVAICERHHSMMHELAGDFEGQTNKGLLKKAKPKELESLYLTLQNADIDIYEHIFDENESLEGRDYYISYLKIWNDTMNVSMGTLIDEIDARLDGKYQEEISKVNLIKLNELREKAMYSKMQAQRELEGLDLSFKEIGDSNIDVTIDNENNNEIINDNDIEEGLKELSNEELEQVYLSMMREEELGQVTISNNQDEDNSQIAE